jgi:hypothetical protein
LHELPAAPCRRAARLGARPRTGPMPPELLPVWLDCDPGHDDALAIILAAYTPGLRLLGISTCHGNQTLAKTTANAKRVLAMAGIADVCVVPGAARPLLRAPRVCEEIHGDSGLDGPDVALHAHLDAQAAEPITEAAVVYMHRALLAAHASWCATPRARIHRGSTEPRGTLLTRRPAAAARHWCARAR